MVFEPHVISCTYAGAFSFSYHYGSMKLRLKSDVQTILLWSCIHYKVGCKAGIEVVIFFMLILSLSTFNTFVHILSKMHK